MTTEPEQRSGVAVWLVGAVVVSPFGAGLLAFLLCGLLVNAASCIHYGFPSDPPGVGQAKWIAFGVTVALIAVAARVLRAQLWTAALALVVTAPLAFVGSVIGWGLWTQMNNCPSLFN